MAGFASAAEDMKNTIGELTENLASTTAERDSLMQQLANERSMVDTLQSAVQDVQSNVGTLQKLSQTDPELLKKYSKVYFLNENYKPKSLTQIDSQHIYNQEKEQYFLTEAFQFLKNLLQDASSTGIDIQILSAHRSFSEQAGVKSSYAVTYGRGANSFSADQGYSEHQLGTAVDFTDAKVGGTFLGFDKTETYKWLADNAYKYGFILSYPESNGYYIYEPWHWRFVGRNLAGKLHDQSKYFYDIDQRDIDSYLISLFD